MKFNKSKHIGGGKNTQTKRIEWVDVARGIAFLMVLYSHQKYCNDTIMRFFSPIFLTMFFFVSGYLFKSGSRFLEMLEQKIRTLFIPFLIFGLMNIIITHIITLKDDVTPFGEQIINMLSQNGKDNSIWFLPSLFCYSIIFWVVEKNCNSCKSLCIAAFILFLLNWVLKEICSMPYLYYHIDSSLYACSYMALGRAYRLNEKNFDNKISIRVLVTALLLYFLVVFCVPYKISFTGSKLLIDSICVVLTGLCLCIGLSKLCRNRLLMFVGSNSLLYFCLHGKVYAILTALLERFVSQDILITPLLYSFCGFAITIISAIILVIPVWVINRWFSFTTGKGYRLW